MKNIHLLKTTNTSKILKDLVDKTYQFKKEATFGNRIELPLNIYITSDEEIKEGDYYYNERLNKIFQAIAKSGYNTVDKESKVTLTTDQDLIKDDVQAIDDEFLEWFVKNPSCEEVEIVEELKYFNLDELRERHLKGLPHIYSEKIGYKIIIPKEESKKETLEEIANKLSIKEAKDLDLFLKGIEWQKEKDRNKFSEEEVGKQKMYSEEEVLVKLYECLGHFAYQHNIVINGNEIDKWFEKFKKK
jgi:hypothetical protein